MHITDCTIHLKDFLVDSFGGELACLLAYPNSSAGAYYVMGTPGKKIPRNRFLDWIWPRYEGREDVFEVIGDYIIRIPIWHRKWANTLTPFVSEYEQQTGRLVSVKIVPNFIYWSD